MSVDPADDCTFWYTNEYVSTLGFWQTQIAALRFVACGGDTIFGDGFETPKP
jgi:hypothetical protein